VPGVLGLISDRILKSFPGPFSSAEPRAHIK
jgi:hypothetical protein